MRTAHKAKKTINRASVVALENKIIQNSRKEFVEKRIPFVFMPCVLNKRHLSAYLYTPSGNPYGFRLSNLRYFSSAPTKKEAIANEKFTITS